MNEDIEIIRGSGNLFRDFDDPDADILQTKALLAAEIIGILDDRKLSTRQASQLTGVDQSDFVRIRKPDLKRFTIDRLISILNKFNQQVDIDIKVTNRSNHSEPAHPHV